MRARAGYLVFSLLLITLTACAVYPHGNRIRIRLVETVDRQSEYIRQALLDIEHSLRSVGFENSADARERDVGFDLLFRSASSNLIRCVAGVTREYILFANCSETWRPWFWQPTQFSDEFEGIESQIISYFSEIGEVQARRCYFTNEEEIVLGPDDWDQPC